MELEVEVTGIASAGAGVGRLPDGRVTFVHRTAPGDRALVRVTEEKPRWTRSTLVRLIEPGPGRREAPCPHYERCGGCTLEHLEYPAQLAGKATMVKETLARIGGLEIERPEIVPSPDELYYRNRVSFTLRRRPDGVVAGFHELDRPDRIVDISERCMLLEAPLAAAWSALRESWGSDASRLPSGEELRLTLRATADGDVTLLVEGGYGPGRPAELLERVPGLRSIWHRPGHVAGPAGSAAASSDAAVVPETVDSETEQLPGPPGSVELSLLAGEAVVTDHWSDETIRLRGDVFTQVNRRAAALVQTHALSLLEAAAPSSVLDAYAGVGLYTRALSRWGLDVAAIEAHPLAAAEVKRSAPDALVLAARVEDVLDRVLPVDAAVLNPPRGGLEDSVPARLVEKPPARVVYVSCDPATLARDLKRLGDAYRMTSIRCFDMFPQTAHVETVVELECAIT